MALLTQKQILALMPAEIDRLKAECVFDGRMAACTTDRKCGNTVLWVEGLEAAFFVEEPQCPECLLGVYDFERNPANVSATRRKVWKKEFAAGLWMSKD